MVYSIRVYNIGMKKNKVSSPKTNGETRNCFGYAVVDRSNPQIDPLRIFDSTDITLFDDEIIKKVLIQVIE